MARPREFEEKEVLDRALDVFWTRGYEATSVQDLVDATGLGRASLYGAFGDKAQLFGRVLDHYVAKLAGPTTSLTAGKSAREALEGLLYGWLAATCPKEGPKGCFLVLSGTAREDSPAAREALAATMARMEKLLEGLIVQGQDRGELARRAEPRALAPFLLVVIQGIATTARAGWSRERLRPVVEEALAHLDRA
jgi:TetR/AcrR family transcriptional repressor of nem operon